jgi:hypothetical protein
VDEVIKYTPSPEMLRLQKRMAKLFQKQKAKGGIIDLEEEKNKFLVPSVSPWSNCFDFFSLKITDFYYLYTNPFFFLPLRVSSSHNPQATWKAWQMRARQKLGINQTAGNSLQSPEAQKAHPGKNIVHLAIQKNPAIQTPVTIAFKPRATPNQNDHRPGNGITGGDTAQGVRQKTKVLRSVKSTRGLRSAWKRISPPETLMRRTDQYRDLLPDSDSVNRRRRDHHQASMISDDKRPFPLLILVTKTSFFGFVLC